MNNLNTTPKKVAPIMKNMKVGDVEIYPSFQKDSLESTRNRLQSKFPSVRFSILKVDNYNYQVIRKS